MGRRSSVVTDKQKAYADAVLNGASLSDAATSAGYAAVPQNNSKTVQFYIARARDEITDVTMLKRLDVLQMFLEAVDMSRMQADPTAMINGADKIAKMMGYYAPETHQVNLTVEQGSLSRRIRSMTDAELLEIAANNAKVVEGELV